MATLDERRQLLSMILDGVYVGMAQGLVIGLKPKPEFLTLFNLGEPVTTCASELVTGGMEQSPNAQQLTFLGFQLVQTGSVAWLKRVV